MAAGDMENELRQKLEAYRQEATRLSGSPLTLFRARHTDLLREGATHLLYRESPELSARRQLGRSQSMALLGLLLLVVALTLLAPVRTLVTLNAVFIAYCLGIAGLRYFLLSHLLKEGRPRYVPQGERLTDDELPIATVICPLYKEERSLPNLIGALEALDYPADKLDIKIVDAYT